MSDYTLHFDGSVGPKNPGLTGGYGFVIQIDGKICYEESGALAGQIISNNYAEFHAVYKGLEVLNTMAVKGDRVFVRGDSQLVINMMNGKFKGKETSIYWPAFEKAKNSLKSFRNKYIPISFDWVPREMNSKADKLADYKTAC